MGKNTPIKLIVSGKMSYYGDKINFIGVIGKNTPIKFI